MVLRPLPASKFVRLDEWERDALIASNFVPVNEVFLPYWRNGNGINLLYGSYGSGKSVFVVDEHIRAAIENKYFRCYFGRKVLDTVRGTIFQTIIDRIRELKKEKFFHFSDKPNGSMVITCLLNGNQFIPFGANDSQSLKSIKDPTHFICEELDQFSFTDFGFIYSRLRTQKAVTQFYGMFNTERVYKSHWIRRMLMESAEYKDQVVSVKANYYHNAFVDREAYEKKLRLISGGDAMVFNAIAHGEWGMVRTGSEFWKQFSELKHVKPVELRKSTIHVSLDENVTPYVTVSCWQIDVQAKQLTQVHELPCESPDNNAVKAAMKLVRWLREIDYKDTVFVYGDPSSSKRSTIDENNLSFYDKFFEILRKEGYSVTNRVRRSAPEVALSADFINAIYESNLYGWSIVISDRCFTSIEDYLLVKQDAEGRMLKQKEKDKESGVTYEPAGHFSDAKRYFVTTVLANEFVQFKSRGKRTGIIAGQREF